MENVRRFQDVRQRLRYSAARGLEAGVQPMLCELRQNCRETFGLPAG